MITLFKRSHDYVYILQRSKPNADVEERSRSTFTKSIRTAKYLPCPSLKLGALNPFALLTITPQSHSITQGCCLLSFL